MLDGEAHADALGRRARALEDELDARGVVVGDRDGIALPAGGPGLGGGRRVARADGETDTLELALAASGCDQPTVLHRPRLLSDNGSSYIAGDLADFLEDK
ncbi:MAG TPA: hypothetical protein RMH80_34340, partial [Polyangiaceae bacterium LLY-WYZ-15_(1-7)]|nr:hypothetical protein [Polyangiaceae bacterium LLY-WYZ-15_(1-7)]